MKALEKLSNNILSKEAIIVLGLPLYVQYIGSFIILLPKILKSHDFRPLDKVMGSRAKKFNYRGNSFFSTANIVMIIFRRIHLLLV